MADNPPNKQDDCSGRKKKKRKSKRVVGRPTLYKKAYCKQLLEFFDIPHIREREIVHSNSKNGSEWVDIKETPNAIPFFGKFAQKIGVSLDVIYDWAKKYPEFSVAFTRARQLREEMVASLALRGLYNPTFAMFYLTNRYEGRYKNKTEVDAKVKGEVTYREAYAKILKKAKEIITPAPPTAASPA